MSQLGVGLNGAINYTVNLTASGINFHSVNGSNQTDVFQATVTSLGIGTLTVTVADITNPANTTGPLSFSLSGLTKTGSGTTTLNASNAFGGPHDGERGNPCTWEK